eukprot:TRINITY_DN3580_c0_g1_i1.p1 TRINITY_DN3580_c0_g1~~TRINITY_DN3580_c0_g1_i1.p1  ORF type:complete len:275 (+),score=28.36 TRINITY_DN3580_c0_g1_i1:163-987(+)
MEKDKATQDLNRSIGHSKKKSEGKQITIKNIQIQPQHYEYLIEQLPNLTELSIHSCRLREIPSDKIGLSASKWELKSLQFGRNKLKCLPADFDKAFPHLTNLELHENSLKGADLSILLNLEKTLTKLVVDSNQLEVIPSVIFKLSNLEVLSLADNEISEISSKISNLKNLKKLNLNNNQISHLSSTICIGLSSLVTLQLDNNILKSIPKQISELTLLTELSLGNNKIVAMPKTLSEMPQLITLRLHDNNLVAWRVPLKKMGPMFWQFTNVYFRR